MNSLGRNIPNNNIEKAFSGDNLYHKKKINENMDANNENNNINNNKNHIPTGHQSVSHKLKNSNIGSSSPQKKEKIIRISEFKIEQACHNQNKNESKHSLNENKDLINRLKNQASYLKSSITNKNHIINNKDKDKKDIIINCFQIDDKENNKHLQNELSHCHLVKGINIISKHETFDVEHKKYYYGDKNKFNKNSYFFNEKNNNSNNLSNKNDNNKENDMLQKIKNLKTFHPGKSNNNRKSISIKVNKDIENNIIINTQNNHETNNNESVLKEKNKNKLPRNVNKSKDKTKNKDRNISKVASKEKKIEKEKLENKEEKEIKKNKEEESTDNNNIKNKVIKKEKEKNKNKENKQKEINKETNEDIQNIKNKNDAIIKEKEKEKEKDKNSKKKKDNHSKNKTNIKNENKENQNPLNNNNNDKDVLSSPTVKEEKIIEQEEEKVIYFDISNINDVQIPKDYINVIYYNLLVEENIELNPKPIYSYMKNQNEINDQMRSILVDWIIDVHHKFGFTDETLFMTVLIIDRYCSIEQITRIKYQCLGITALMIACKHEEINVPKVEDFIYITDNAYTKDEVFQMENDVLSKLNFSLLYPSPIKFYEYLSLHFNFSKKYHMLGKYLMESFLLDLNYIKYKPSIISCACTYIVMKFFKMPNYRQSYDKKFYLVDENINTIVNGFGVKDCAQDICLYVDNINNTNLLSCQKKYTKPEFESVSTLISNNKS